MKFRLLLLVFCFAVVAAQGQNEAREAPSDAVRYIDAWLEAQQVYDRLPGISVAIVADQEVIWSKGYGLADIKKKHRQPHRRFTASAQSPSCSHP